MTTDRTARQDSPLTRNHCDAPSSSASNIVTCLKYVFCTALVVRHRASPHDSDEHIPDLRNKATENKLTFVRLADSQRSFHLPRRNPCHISFATGPSPENFSPFVFKI